MAFNVRIFGHRGVDQLLVNKPVQFSSDSVMVLVQPYEFAELLAADTVAVSSAPNDSTHTRLLRVEVPDGASIRYEINPPGRAVAANVNSPILSGRDQFYFRTGFTISIIDAAGLP